MSKESEVNREEKPAKYWGERRIAGIAGIVKRAQRNTEGFCHSERSEESAFLPLCSSVSSVVEGFSETMSIENAAIVDYVLSLRPSARLKYYWLSKAERLTLEAMLTVSRGTGFAVFAKIETLAELAGLDEKSVHNAIHGYKRKNGTEHIGLLARAILSQTAPPKRGIRRPATYRINFDAFTIDPRKVGAIEKRLQLNLPGVKMPPLPDAHNVASESRENLPQSTRAKPVDSPPTSATVADVIRNSCRSHPQPLPLTSATVADGFEKLAFDLSLSPSIETAGGSKRGVAHVQNPCGTATLAGDAKKQPGSALEKLHPNLREKLFRQLRLNAEASIGATFTLEQRKFRILDAAREAGIWEHVAQAIAEEMYQSWLKGES